MYKRQAATYPGNSKLAISLNITGSTLRIHADREIPALSKFVVHVGYAWAGASYSGGFPRSCNENIQLFTRVDDYSTPYACSFLNLQAINNVYITSPNLSSYSTVSPFTHTIPKKVPVAANCGYMIFDQRRRRTTSSSVATRRSRP